MRQGLKSNKELRKDLRVRKIRALRELCDLAGLAGYENTREFIDTHKPKTWRMEGKLTKAQVSDLELSARNARCLIYNQVKQNNRTKDRVIAGLSALVIMSIFVLGYFFKS